MTIITERTEKGWRWFAGEYKGKRCETQLGSIRESFETQREAIKDANRAIEDYVQATLEAAKLARARL
jgi:hypothetical protein